jgi:hypothetical protein
MMGALQIEQSRRTIAVDMIASARFKSIGRAIVLAVIGAMAVVRFCRLETAPPGFYNDEAHIAAHVICLSRTGHDAGGQDWPLFSGSGGGGYATPTHLYPTVIWIRIFGTSIRAFRAYAAWTMCVAIAGLFLLSRLFLGTRGATCVALAACVWPWMFQFSRLAVDDPAMFVLGLSWGLYFFLRSPRLVDAVAAAFFLSAAAYAYPAGRIALPLLMLPTLWLKLTRLGINRRYIITFCVAGVAFCLPLIDQIVNGTLMTRYAVVGIFSEHYRRVHGLTWTGACGVFFGNYLRHFGPNYLFVHGDANLRHSSQFCGELSWLDIAALAGGIIVLAWKIIRRRRVGWSPWAAFCAAGFLIGIVPAALTWEGVPHSLRSAASWPFLCMLSGYIIWKCEQRWPASLLAFAAIALAFAAGLTRYYFRVYPARAASAFQVPVKQGAEYGRKTGDWGPFRAAARDESYDDAACAYFLMAYGGKSCDEARTISTAR